MAVMLICVHVPSPNPDVLPIHDVCTFSAGSANACSVARKANAHIARASVSRDNASSPVEAKRRRAFPIRIAKEAGNDKAPQ
jgi:hypothetical protein